VGGRDSEMIRSVSLLEQKIGIHASFYTQGRASKLSQNSLFIFNHLPSSPLSCTDNKTK